MKIGFVGLGKMGANMVERLLQNKHDIVAFDLNASARENVAKKGATTASSLKALVDSLPSPRSVWVMVPAGGPTEEAIENISKLMKSGDTIIDGGNSFYKDSIRLCTKLKEKGIDFIDVGTSGGIWGLENGYCLMIGGEKSAVSRLDPIFKSLAPQDGYQHVGPSGAGHFVKMVHNGIEYGMLQAYAEGFQILNAKKEYSLDLARISKLWNRGSVVRSWLLELAEDAFKKDPNLASIKGYVEDSGEGRWTVEEALELNVTAPVITTSLLERIRSRQEESFAAKVIAALRNEFGGHAVRKER